MVQHGDGEGNRHGGGYGGEHDGQPVPDTKLAGPITLGSHQPEETRSASALQPLVDSDNDPDNDGEMGQLMLKEVVIVSSVQSEKQIQCVGVKYLGRRRRFIARGDANVLAQEDDLPDGYGAPVEVVVGIESRLITPPFQGSGFPLINPNLRMNISVPGINVDMQLGDLAQDDDDEEIPLNTSDSNEDSVVPPSSVSRAH